MSERRIEVRPFHESLDLVDDAFLAAVGGRAAASGAMRPRRNHEGAASHRCAACLCAEGFVAAEEFIAAVAGQHDFDMPRREAGDEISGENRDIGDRIVEMQH